MTTADRVLDYARGQIGKPYIWGAEGPNAFDCSGLVWAAYRTVGIYLPRVTADQIHAGSSVSRANLRIGDLVFPSAHHVQIYAGNGKVVEAARPGTKVREVSIWGFIAGRRIIPVTTGTAYPGYPIRYGSKGAYVVMVQHKVGVVADGSFGPATKAAVVKWQKSHGLVGDGSVGPATWKVMFG